MDTGASRDPSKSLLPPVEGTGQKRRHSSLNDQVEAENPSEVSAKEAYREIGSIKRAKPLAVSKNGRNRQTFLPFDRIENTDQTAKAPQRASQNEEIMEAPQRAGKTDETKPKAPQRAGKKDETKPKAPQRAGKKDETKPKAPQRAGKKDETKAKAPQRASQKQPVLDGFFSRSQGLVPRAPSPTTTGQSAENPFYKSDKGPGQGGDDGWESDWVSDVNEKDDYSHLVVRDDEVIGDDKVFPGPEGDDLATSNVPNRTNVETSTAETPEINGQLFKTIREIVEFLKKWANETEFMTLRDKPITCGFWNLISHLGLEFILGLWAPAIHPAVQALFEKGTFSVEDLRKLPSASKERRPGIYMGFILDEIHSDGTVTLALYVGSSICCKVRVHEHQQRSTWKRLKHSLFYQRLMKGEKVEFCVLAAFDSSIERGYLNLLEAIFMFLFGTLLKPKYENEFIKRSTWELYEQLQSVLEPTIHIEGQIVGLNKAWPLNQGFINKGSKTRSVCNNPNCAVITIPYQERKGIDPLAEGEFVSITARKLSNPGDPLGHYICSSCYNFQREHHGDLPDEAFCNQYRQVRYYKRWVENQRKLKQPIHCSGKDCSKVELPTPTKHTIFRMNMSNPSQFFCRPCWEKVHPHNRPVHSEVVCGNFYCGARIGNRTVAGQIVKAMVKGHCYPCANYSTNKRKEAENTNTIDEANLFDEYIYDEKIMRRTMNQIKIDMLTERVKHHCSSCGKEAQKLMWKLQKNRNKGESPLYGIPVKWMVSQHGLLLCPKCKTKDDIELSSLLPVFSNLRPESEILTEWWTLYDPILAEKKQELGIS